MPEVSLLLEDYLDDEALLNEVCRRRLRAKVAKHKMPPGRLVEADRSWIYLDAAGFSNEELLKEIEWRQWMGRMKTTTGAPLPTRSTAPGSITPHQAD